MTAVGGRRNMGKVRSSQNLPKTLTDLYVCTYAGAPAASKRKWETSGGRIMWLRRKKSFLDLIPVMSHGADFYTNILSPDLYLGNRSKCSIRRMCNFLVCATVACVNGFLMSRRVCGRWLSKWLEWQGERESQKIVSFPHNATRRRNDHSSKATFSLWLLYMWQKRWVRWRLFPSSSLSGEPHFGSWRERKRRETSFSKKREKEAGSGTNEVRSEKRRNPTSSIFPQKIRKSKGEEKKWIGRGKEIRANLFREKMRDSLLLQKIEFSGKWETLVGGLGKKEKKLSFSPPFSYSFLKCSSAKKVAKRPFNTPAFPAFCKGKNGQCFKKTKI